MANNRYGKKKTTRNILIAAVVAIVIAVAIFLVVALQKDGAGMNCFQRSKTAASADGVRISAVEYKVVFESMASSYQNSTLSDAEIRNLQESAARQALLQKIYIKEAKALGLSLTDEQKAACVKAADDQISSIEKYYADSMISGGSYSKASLDKQISSYFQHLGMSKDAYRAFLRESAEAEYCGNAINAYYEENGNGIDEDTLVSFYRDSVEKTMTVKAEDGTEKPTYMDGEFWYYMMLYQMGYSNPMYYVPEGFIYVDFIRLEKDSDVEMNETITAVMDGTLSFDELMKSNDNKDSFKSILKAPYPIAEKDHSGLYTSNDVYALAAALEIGQIGSFVEEPKTAEDGKTTVTAYLFRRAEGNMCYDGDHGVIKIDYFDGLHASVESEYRASQWLSDVQYEDVVYAYKGVLE